MISNLLKNKLTILIVFLSMFTMRSYSQDPTELLVVEDTYVSQKDPSVVKNTETDMGVAIDESNGDSRETYLKFDISDLYGKGGIADVALNFTGAQKTDAGWVGISEFYVNLYGYTNEWEETSLTWDEKVKSDSIVLAELDVIGFSETYMLTKTETNDTSLIKYISAAMAKKAQFISFVIKGREETTGSRIWISDKGWKPAKLIVTQSTSIPEPGGETTVDVESITIKAADNATTITTNNGTLQLSAEVLPADATFKNVKWTLDPAFGIATISKTGLVSAKENGSIKVIATSNDGLIEGEYNLTISGQIDVYNLITNGNLDADTDLESWKFGPADAIQPVITDGHAMFPVETAGDYWSYQFQQDKLEAVVGVPYIFSFKAWSNIDRTMIVDFEDPNNNWARYGISSDPEAQNGRADWICSLTTTPTQFKFHVTFDPKMVKENTNQLIVFQAGAETGEIHLDAIELIKESNYTATPKSFSNSSMQIFPNPVQNELNFSEEVSQVRICSVLGQEVKRYSNVASCKFNVSELKSGIYFVTAQNTKGIISTSKIVKN